MSPVAPVVKLIVVITVSLHIVQVKKTFVSRGQYSFSIEQIELCFLKVMCHCFLHG